MLCWHVFARLDSIIITLEIIQGLFDLHVNMFPLNKQQTDLFCLVIYFPISMTNLWFLCCKTLVHFRVRRLYTWNIHSSGWGLASLHWNKTFSPKTMIPGISVDKSWLSEVVTRGKKKPHTKLKNHLGEPHLRGATLHDQVPWKSLHCCGSTEDFLSHSWGLTQTWNHSCKVCDASFERAGPARRSTPSSV